MIKQFKKADIGNISAGISDMKTSYEPYFGHHSIEYRDHKNNWKDISKNILNSFAPKHS